MTIYDSYIKNYHDAGLWTILLREKEGRIESPEAKERHDEIKRAIRRFYKKTCDRANSGETRFGNWDGYAQVPAPGAHQVQRGCSRIL